MKRWLERFRLRKKLSALGRKSEEVFLRAWKDRTMWPEWMNGVRRATQYQDACESTDAIITLTAGGELRVQIKLGYVGYERRQHYFSRGIIILQVKPTWSDIHIRHMTLIMVKKYRKFVRWQERKELQRSRSFLEQALARYVSGSGHPA